MTNPCGTKTASNLPISVDPHGAQINDSLALVSLPSHCLWDELWSGVGVPQRRPFLPITISSLLVRTEVTVGRLAVQAA